MTQSGSRWRIRTKCGSRKHVQESADIAVFEAVANVPPRVHATVGPVEVHLPPVCNTREVRDRVQRVRKEICKKTPTGILSTVVFSQLQHMHSPQAYRCTQEHGCSSICTAPRRTGVHRNTVACPQPHERALQQCTLDPTKRVVKDLALLPMVACWGASVKNAKKRREETENIYINKTTPGSHLVLFPLSIVLA